MWMFSAAVDFQLGEETTSQTVFRQHSTHGCFNEALRPLPAHFPGTRSAEAARVAGMTMIQFGLGFVAGQLHFRCIDHNHKIARILMVSEIGPMFTTQHGGGS